MLKNISKWNEFFKNVMDGFNYILDINEENTTLKKLAHKKLLKIQDNEENSI